MKAHGWQNPVAEPSPCPTAYQCEGVIGVITKVIEGSVWRDGKFVKVVFAPPVKMRDRDTNPMSRESVKRVIARYMKQSQCGR